MPEKPVSEKSVSSYGAFLSWLFSTRKSWIKFNKFLAYISGFIVIAAALTVSINVILRYLFNIPIVIISEIVPLLQIYVTFLAVCWVMTIDGHIRMDLLSNQLQERPRELLNCVTSALSFMYCIYFTISTFLIWWQKTVEGAFVVGVYEIPESVILIALPLAGLLLTFELFSQTIISFLKYKGELWNGI